LPNAVGESAEAVLPKSASRVLKLRSATAALISRFSFSIISAGVLRGAPSPVKPLASYPGANSAIADKSGNPGTGCAALRPKALSLPLLMCSIDEGRASKANCT
jgi:hypothetical protein